MNMKEALPLAEKPVCFGKYVAGQEAAEADCFRCSEMSSCVFNSGLKKEPEEPKVPVSAADILADMAVTFRERNAVYGDNYKMVGRLMAVLFPQGVSAELLHSHQFHLFELKLVKLSRFAISGLTHTDSIHDDAVYSAMIEMILANKEPA